MEINRATKKDQADIERLLEQVCKVHADIRPDLFIEGKRKYTKEELAAIMDRVRQVNGVEDIERSRG